MKENKKVSTVALESLALLSMNSGKTHLSFQASPVSIHADTAELSVCQNVQMDRQTETEFYIPYSTKVWQRQTLANSVKLTSLANILPSQIPYY